VFQPREAAQENEDAFLAVVALLGRLREQGLVDYIEAHVSQTESGRFLKVGPVQLTPDGKAALEHDRRLGPRPRCPDAKPPWRD